MPNSLKKFDKIFNNHKTVANNKNPKIYFIYTIHLPGLGKKFINFGSMMEYSEGNYFSPKNFYAITKYSFQKIEEFYKSNNKKIKFYDLKSNVIERYTVLDDKLERMNIFTTN